MCLLGMLNGNRKTGFKTGNRFGKLETGNGVRPSTYFYLRDQSWIAGGGAKGGEAIIGRTRRRSRPMMGPHPVCG